MKILLEIFFELFKISLFVIGGGYAIIAVSDGVFAKKGWTKEGELFDHLPIFQMIPGLIATHVAVYVGRKMRGWLGSLVGVIAVAIPAIVIFTVVSSMYKSLPLNNKYLLSAFVGLRASLTGIILATILRNWRKVLSSLEAYLVMLAAFALLFLLPVWQVLVLMMVVGLALEFTRARQYNASWLPLLVFLKYGALCFGGGFVIVPMYLEDFVGASAPYLQLGTEVFADVMALSQMTPGPIGVNCATYFGFNLAGIAGAVIASALLLLPGSVLVYFALSSLEKFQSSRIVKGILRGTRPASIALMLVAFGAFAKMTFFGADNGAFNWIGFILTIIALGVTMSKKVNVVLIIIVSALAASLLHAEEITPERFPDSDVVIVEDISTAQYNPDGTCVETSESYNKILTEKGRREESEFELGYSKRYGEAKVLYVGAIDENGVEREIDVSATTSESTDNGSMSANIYDPLDRRIVCTIPGLKIGETLHIKTMRKVFKARCENKWSDLSVMEWTAPILKSTYTVIAPKELPLKKIAIRHPLGNITTNMTVLADGSTKYVFEGRNSARVFSEPDMPPLYTQVQNVRVSTAENWEEISKWYWELCAPHIAKTNAEMVTKAKELKDIRAIFKFVSQEIRYMGLTLEDTSPGYSPHDVDLTFNHRYGVCRDKAGLLVAMLRAAGYEAFPC